jgi:hypothetical protein
LPAPIHQLSLFSPQRSTSRQYRRPHLRSHHWRRRVPSFDLFHTFEGFYGSTRTLTPSSSFHSITSRTSSVRRTIYQPAHASATHSCPRRSPVRQRPLPPKSSPRTVHHRRCYPPNHPRLRRGYTSFSPTSIRAPTRSAVTRARPSRSRVISTLNVGRRGLPCSYCAPGPSV